MNKATSDAAILSISLDRASRETLQAQLTRALRRLVHERRLRPGARLPSSRALAGELSVSRVTVTAVYDQLVAEGFVEGRRGSGVYITADLPDRALRHAAPSGAVALRPPERVPPFENAFPDLREFPHREWARLLARVWRAPGRRSRRSPAPPEDPRRGRVTAGPPSPRSRPWPGPRRAPPPATGS